MSFDACSALELSYQLPAPLPIVLAEGLPDLQSRELTKLPPERRRGRCRPIVVCSGGLAQ